MVENQGNLAVDNDKTYSHAHLSKDRSHIDFNYNRLNFKYEKQGDYNSFTDKNIATYLHSNRVHVYNRVLCRERTLSPLWLIFI